VDLSGAVITADAVNIDFPHVSQVARIRRDGYDASGALTSKEIVHAVTSLDSGRASAADLAKFARGQWEIESVHWLRSLGVCSLLRPVAPECLTESFCNTSCECGARCRRCSEARPARTCNKCNTLRGDGEKLIRHLTAMATLRNLAISLLYLNVTEITRTLQAIARDRNRILDYLPL
jgi:hypothetical protein